eukprot:CAMPEP_0118965950 /NCGR_PEP_ID=MMETSP1173-20130426/3458_1 /TAXON_ID=1034831 /ORGANISM="Rhizochromulina marina cf, Strain CCMP1243" /LENGTH=32 /DNA_ID= /DNA_START= /DNA_END= /DNA_ORIENTATION=
MTQQTRRPLTIHQRGCSNAVGECPAPEPLVPG